MDYAERGLEFLCDLLPGIEQFWEASEKALHLQETYFPFSDHKDSPDFTQPGT